MTLNNKKKKIICLCIIVCILSLVGCNKKTENTNKSNESSTEKNIVVTTSSKVVKIDNKEILDVLKNETRYYNTELKRNATLEITIQIII